MANISRVENTINKTCVIGLVIGLVFAWSLLCQSAHAESLRVTAEWLKLHILDQNILILDTQSEEEYQVDHILGAINLPDSHTCQ